MSEGRSLSAVLQLYHEDKTLQAASLLEELQSEMSNEEREEASQQEHTLKQIREEAAEARTTLSQLKEETDWTVGYNGKVTKVWWKPPVEGDQGIATLKIESRLVCNVQHLCCAVYELDLYVDLLWYVKQYEVLEEETKCRRCLYLRAKMFWPLADRDFYSYAYAIDALDEHDGILITVKDLASRPDKNGDYMVRMNRQSKETVRGKMMFSTLFVAESASVTRFTALVKVDPALAFLPAPVMNFLGKNFAAAVPKMFESKANNLTQEHERRLATGEIYRWYRGRMIDFWTRKGDQEALQQLVDGTVEETDRISSEFDSEAARKGPGKAAALALFKK